jgi:hypothetical protein
MASETGSGDIQIDVSSAIKEVARLNAAYETMRKGGVSAAEGLTKAFTAQQAAQAGLTKEQIRAANLIAKSQRDAEKAAERTTNKIENELTGQITKTEALTRAIDAQTDALKNAAPAAGGLSKGADALTSGSNKAAESAEKLAGFLGIVSPEAAGLTREIGLLAKGMSVAGSAQTALSGVLGAGSALLGPLAAVAAAAAFAYSQYAENAEKAAEAEKKWRQEQKDRSELGGKLTDQITAMQREQAVLAGTMTQVEADTRDAAEAIEKDYSESVITALNKVDDFKAKLGELDAKIKSGDGYAYELLDQQNALNVSLEQAQVEYDGLNNRLNTLRQTSADLIAAREEERRKTEEAREAEKRRADAARKAKEDQAKAAREAEKALADELAAIASLTKAEEDHDRAIRKGIKALEGQKDAAEASARTQTEVITRAQEAALQQADITARAALREAKTAEERKAIEIALQDARVAINADAEREITAIRDAALDDARQKAEAAAELEKENTEAMFDSLANGAAKLTASLGDLFGKIADNHADTISGLEDKIETAEDKGDHRKANRLKKQLAEEKAAAETALERQKAAGIISATISGAKAAVEALALPPAPNFIAAGLSAAATGVEIATIAAQPTTFHSGTGFAPDETTAKILRGEAVLTEDAAAGLGRETIDQLNRGGGGTMDVRIVAWDVDPGSMAPIPVSGAGGDGTRSAFYGSPTARGGRKRGKAPGVRRSGHSSRTK